LVPSQILLTRRGYFRSVRQYQCVHEPAGAKAFFRPVMPAILATVG
jgi:hypothetical protein